MFEAIYNTLGIPFGYALGLLSGFTNYIVALVILTVLLRLILLPTSIKQQKNSAKQMRLQAKVNKIRAKYAGQQGNDVRMKIQEETQELYRREGFNASQMGCMPLLVQMIVMMGLYGAIYSPLTHVLHIPDSVLNVLKAAFYYPEAIPAKATRDELNILGKFDQVFANLPNVADHELVTDKYINSIRDFIQNFKLGPIDLTQTPKGNMGSLLVLIPILAGLTALLSAAFTYLKQRKSNPEMAKNPMMGCMTLFSPLISVVFAISLPAGIGFYWIISNVLSFIQLIVLSAIYKPETIIASQMIDETVERRSKEESIKKRKALMEAQRQQN